MTRRVREDGAVELEAPDLRFVIARHAPGVVSVTIHGDDRDQLGAAPFAELEAELARHSPLTVLFDTVGTSGAATPVREAWTSWFAANRSRLRAVHVLTSTKFVTTAIDVARHFSRTGELIQITTDRAAFDRVRESASRRR
jgi:hypothetical protein